MDFFLRQLEPLLREATERLGRFVGASRDDLVFVENATAAMNIVAASTKLSPGDEVLWTDHEYGAVQRLWKRVCTRAGAAVRMAALPFPLTSRDQVIEAIFERVTPRTRLIIVSHVTSPTATILPVPAICRRAREQGIPVCVDGPHAVAMIPLELRRLGCDFYTASCHKWLSAPFGTGFLWIARHRQNGIEPAVVSWGRSVAGRPPHWKDEFQWIGTRDPAGFLAVPAAVEFLESCGLATFRDETHGLAEQARARIVAVTGLEPPIPNSPDWYGSMISLPLPPLAGDPLKPGYRDPLQDRLWDRHRIEVPVVHWQGRRFLRVSCHLYNTTADIEQLAEALATELGKSHPAAR